jgi:hypothetical protein
LSEALAGQTDLPSAESHQGTAAAVLQAAEDLKTPATKGKPANLTDYKSLYLDADVRALTVQR